jgi:heme-degrading monooxygenase HmoA
LRVVDAGASSSVLTLWERVRAFVAGVRAAAARGASQGGGVSSFVGGRVAGSRVGEFELLVVRTEPGLGELLEFLW